MPPGVNVSKQSGATPEELLERGDVDAIFCPELPPEFLAGRSNMRRLFTNPQAEMENYVRKAGHVPITHTIVMNRALFEKSPDVKLKANVAAVLGAMRPGALVTGGRLLRFGPPPLPPTKAVEVKEKAKVIKEIGPGYMY